jgi:hypothetical protein
MIETIKVVKSELRTRNNSDCPWSVGITNLTKREADIIEGQLLNMRRTFWDERIIVERIKKTSEPTTAYPTTTADLRARAIKNSYEGEDDRKLYYRLEREYGAQRAMEMISLRRGRAEMNAVQSLTAEALRTKIAERKATEQEPEKPRNRFSGLDIE